MGDRATERTLYEELVAALAAATMVAPHNPPVAPCCAGHKRIIISDAYQLPRWRRAQPRDWLDIHHYQCFGVANLALVDYDQHASIVDEFTHMHQSLQRPTIIGEWSAILPPAIAMTPPTIAAYILAQQTAFASADAHFFWSYKTESNDGWNYRWLVEQGIMP